MNFSPLSLRLQGVFNTIYSFIQHFIFRCFVLEILLDLKFVENTKTAPKVGREVSAVGAEDRESGSNEVMIELNQR